MSRKHRREQNRASSRTTERSSSCRRLKRAVSNRAHMYTITRRFTDRTVQNRPTLHTVLTSRSCHACITHVVLAHLQHARVCGASKKQIAVRYQVLLTHTQYFQVKSSLPCHYRISTPLVTSSLCQSNPPSGHAARCWQGIF